MSKITSLAVTIVNTNCRNNIYPRSEIKRFPVADQYLHWSTIFSSYDPPTYTATHIKNQEWADPDMSHETFRPQWNQLDGKVNRVSHHGLYKIDEFGFPLNPIGRTGLRGRGLLGRWGPNHAADPIVTRWKRDIEGNVIHNEKTKKKIIQMVAIQRHDNKMWAIPGGMVDAGEKISSTLRREFMEEALDSLSWVFSFVNNKESTNLNIILAEEKQMIDDFFSCGTEVYKGYVDDYRNTDNAWIETEAFNYHDEMGEQVGKLELSAGDDAASVQWMDVDQTKQLHANHASIVEKVTQLLNGHW